MLKSMRIIHRLYSLTAAIRGPDLWIPKYSDLWHRGIVEIQT